MAYTVRNGRWFTRAAPGTTSKRLNMLPSSMAELHWSLNHPVDFVKVVAIQKARDMINFA